MKYKEIVQRLQKLIQKLQEHPEFYELDSDLDLGFGSGYELPSLKNLEISKIPLIYIKVEGKELEIHKDSLDYYIKKSKEKADELWSRWKHSHIPHTYQECLDKFKVEVLDKTNTYIQINVI